MFDGVKKSHFLFAFVRVLTDKNINNYKMAINKENGIPYNGLNTEDVRNKRNISNN